MMYLTLACYMIFPEKKKARSQMWGYFGFGKTDTSKPPPKQNLNIKKVMYKICHKEYSSKGKH